MLCLIITMTAKAVVRSKGVYILGYMLIARKENS